MEGVVGGGNCVNFENVGGGGKVESISYWIICGLCAKLWSELITLKNGNDSQPSLEISNEQRDL